MKYKIFLSRTALKELDSLDKKTQKRIKKSLETLGDNPFKFRSGTDIKKLKGARDPVLYRLRIGDYRLIYAVIGKEVRITEIIHRSRGYSFLE